MTGAEIVCCGGIGGGGGTDVIGSITGGGGGAIAAASNGGGGGSNAGAGGGGGAVMGASKDGGGGGGGGAGAFWSNIGAGGARSAGGGGGGAAASAGLASGLPQPMQKRADASLSTPQSAHCMNLSSTIDAGRVEAYVTVRARGTEPVRSSRVRLRGSPQSETEKSSTPIRHRESGGGPDALWAHLGDALGQDIDHPVLAETFDQLLELKF